MCAICGWVNQKKNILEKQEKFKEMVELMNCRGKDNTGFYFSENVLLGHKRLAIIDIENGNQPMYYKEYTIVYNGELYNTEEIREDLINKGYKFETTCDTEVLLKGYAEYKEKILDKVEGIFAFCVYNQKESSIFLARDRFGVKPLYYCLKDGNLVFASMIRAILKSEIVKPVLDIEKLGEILALGPSKKLGSGVFKDVQELRPAHYLTYKKGKINIIRYWNVKTEECKDTFEKASEKIKELLTDSIKRQMVSDVPIATLLSGGLDSSIITAVVALNKDEKLTTYSVDYEDNDKYFKKTAFTVALDEHYIDIMSKEFNTDHKYKFIKQKDVVDYLKRCLYAKDYPGMTDIDSSMLWFSHEIAKDYKVILSGECADEIFGGYPWFYREDLNDRKYFPWINNLEYRQKLLNKDLQEKIDLVKIVEKEYEDTINELEPEDRENKEKRLFYINMTHFMTGLLDRKDRMTMDATLEARVPFADTKLIEYLWNLPFDYKYKDGVEKHLLREAFKGILPDEVLYRKKNPYPKTHHPYFLEAVTKLLKERLENPNCSLYKILNMEEINKLLETKEDDILPWYGQLMTKPQLIAYLYQFDVWIEEYGIEILI